MTARVLLLPLYIFNDIQNPVQPVYRDDVIPLCDLWHKPLTAGHRFGIDIGSFHNRF
jgi:hypothetical protein